MNNQKAEFGLQERKSVQMAPGSWYKVHVGNGSFYARFKESADGYYFFDQVVDSVVRDQCTVEILEKEKVIKELVVVGHDPVRRDELERIVEDSNYLLRLVGKEVQVHISNGDSTSAFGVLAKVGGSFLDLSPYIAQKVYEDGRREYVFGEQARVPIVREKTFVEPLEAGTLKGILLLKNQACEIDQMRHAIEEHKILEEYNHMIHIQEVQHQKEKTNQKTQSSEK